MNESETDTVVFCCVPVWLWMRFKCVRLSGRGCYLQMHYSISKQMIFDEEESERERESESEKDKVIHFNIILLTIKPYNDPTHKG